ncbi:MAG: hypothetical protein E6R03_09650 [Hyphomicrobiaceae bacterium]|nr:MAG: hypothetical protein E6R03_09650 [Hyphomicrobiaceae bacterium]
MATVIKNANVEDVILRFEHDRWLGTIYVRYEGSVQGYLWGDLSHGDAMLRFVSGVCAVFGVKNFAHVKDLYCRVELRDGLIARVGHITDNRWI